MVQEIQTVQNWEPVGLILEPEDSVKRKSITKQEMEKKYEWLLQMGTRLSLVGPMEKLTSMFLTDVKNLTIDSGGPEYVSAKKAAEILDLNPRTVSNWAREGRFPGAQKTGPNGQWRIPLGEILADDPLEKPELMKLWTPDEE